MFDSGILSEFDFNMTKSNSTMTAAKKSNKRLISRPPETPWFFINFSYFSYTNFSNSLIIQAKFHELAKCIILYSKIELLQSESLIENKKIST